MYNNATNLNKKIYMYYAKEIFTDPFENKFFYLFRNIFNLQARKLSYIFNYDYSNYYVNIMFILVILAYIILILCTDM